MSEKILNWEEYEACARTAGAEGIVLLKNEDNMLPLQENVKIALFGRMQNHYYKSGTGSGGMVNAPKVWGILDALKQENVTLNQGLLEMYAEFEKGHPFDKGVGFGNEPWSQIEMEISEEVAGKAAQESDLAVVIIGRTAGEAQDYVDEPGAFRLSEIESRMLRNVRAAFDKVVLVMNASALLDLREIMEISPNALLYAWQGGEMGGLATVDILMGRVCPSGRLTDSCVKSVESASAYENFGRLDYNCYAEDIYVGYRYYETFGNEGVLYPFGYGLSYTEFAFSDCMVAGKLSQISKSEELYTINDCGQVEIKATVTNTGKVAGKEVLQVYVSAPQGKLGRPAVALAGFAKTRELQPGEAQELTVVVDPYTLAAYDDNHLTEYPYSYVLEAGSYEFFVGKNVVDRTAIGSVEVSDTILVCKLNRRMTPKRAFDRIRPEISEAGFVKKMEPTPVAESRDYEQAVADQPAFLPYTGDQGIKLIDVKTGKASMDAFVAQMSDEDLSCIVRGEGMGSPKVTAGTAAAFGGVNKHLKEMGIPCGCCSDGPSGMRLDSGARAFSLPSGTMLACTWNEEINEKLYSFLGLEMTKNQVDVLLGPGINIHRHPLNGRNFEYFSEDPLITGKMAAAQIRGLQKGGATGTLKHFCGNNQEANRYSVDSVISERAIREIYLKGFEMAIREGGGNSVMTTYGCVNGAWTSSIHDLNTCILREEWGFEGIVMTDWWAEIGELGGRCGKNDFALMILAQNDFYAVCPDGSENTTGDNTLEALEKGELTRGHLTRIAKNICGFLMNTEAMNRLNGESTQIVIEGRQDIENDTDSSNVPYYEIQDGTVIDLSERSTEQGTSIVIGLEALERGCYYIDMTASSDLDELAQIPVGVFLQSVPGGTFTFQGTNGAKATIRRKILLSAKYGVLRFYFAGNGLKLQDIKFTFEKGLDSEINQEEYIYG